MNKKRITKLEIIKLVIIAILLISLFVLAFVLMSQYIDDQTSKLTIDEYNLIKNDYKRFSYNDYLFESLVYPSMVGVRCDQIGEKYLICKDTRMEDVVDSLHRYYKDFFLTDNIIEKENYDKRELISKIATSDYIYIKYQTELPKSVICKLSNVDYMGENIGDEGIYEAFIFVAGQNSTVKPSDIGVQNGIYICMLAMDISQNPYLYYYKSEPVLGNWSFNSEFYLAFRSDDNIKDFDFIVSTELSNGIDYGKIPFSSSLMVFDKNIPLENVIRNIEFKNTSENSFNILRYFKMNPDKVSYYVDTTLSTTFYEEGRNIKIGSDGKCSFEALSNEYSVPLDMTSAVPDVMEYIGATSKFILGMPIFSDYISRENVNLVLSEISVDGKNAKISYGLTYKNTPILSDGSHIVASFRISEGKITSFVFYIYTYEDVEGDFKLRNNRLELLSSILIEKKTQDIKFAYDFLEDGEAVGIWYKCFSESEVAYED